MKSCFQGLLDKPNNTYLMKRRDYSQDRHLDTNFPKREAHPDSLTEVGSEPWASWLRRETRGKMETP